MNGFLNYADLLAAGITPTGFAGEGHAYDFSNAFLTAGFQSGVPEPSTWAMMVLGFAGLGYAGFRRAKARPAIA